MKKILFAIAVAFVALLGPPLAYAQAVNKPMEMTWVNPTTSPDGVPLTSALAVTGIEIYLSTSPISDTASTPTVTVGAVQTTAFTMSVTNGQTVYFRAKAVNASGKSALSAQASTVVSLSTIPGVPQTLTIILRISPTQ